MQAANPKIEAHHSIHTERYRQALDASKALLQEVRSPDRIYGLPASQGLIRLLTMAGRLPYKRAVASLTIWEREVLHSIIGDEECLLFPPSELNPTLQERTILITHSLQGKVSLFLREEIQSCEEMDADVVIGGFSLQPTQFEAVSDQSLEGQALEDAERLQLYQLLQQFEQEGVLEQRVAEVADWVNHVESIYIYIDRCIFSRSDVGNTLLRSNGLLSALRRRPLAEWSPQERLFVAAAHILFRTGRVIRLEEFNGQCLSACALREWLWRKCCLYHKALRREMPSGWRSSPLYELANYVGQLATEVNTTDWIRIRRLNGLTMLKTEHLIASCPSEKVPASLPPLLQLFVTRVLQGKPGRDSTPIQIIGDVTYRILQDYPLTEAVALLTRLVEDIVLSSVLEADADYGMSSSIRNPWRLRGREDERAAGALSLEKGDFFCAVLPHPHFITKVSKEVIFETLYTSALRMEFNRWHFIAGNFPREEVPLKRHYYFPPTMPDIAEWSDMRHSGHTTAGVRYSIRVPGPSLWTPPWLSFGNEYRGCYDVRLVRCQGPAFSQRELWVTIRHVALMSAFWRAIEECVEQTDHAIPLFPGFTRLYYQEEQWRDCLNDILLLPNKEEIYFDA